MATALQSSGNSAFTYPSTDALLLCAICRSQLSHPKVLECQHMFCLKCLKDQCKADKKPSKTLKCCVCRKVTKLPAKGASDLPENYVINGIISMLKKRRDSEQGVTAKPTTKEKGAATATAKGKVAATKNAKGKVAAIPIKGPVKKNLPDKNANTGKAIMIYSSSEEDSECDDDELSPMSSDEDSQDEGSEDSMTSDDECSDISGDFSDVPQTPTLKEFGNIKVGMEVYIFNKRGKRYNAVVKFLETFERKPPGSTRAYAGVSLEKDVPALITDDIDDMDDTYLSYWLGENPNPCAVVRVDQCVPRALVDMMIGYP